jgi:hypothetical protein
MVLLMSWIYHDSFFEEAKKQVIEIMGPKCSPFIKLKLLFVSVAGGYEYDENGFPSVYKVDEKGFPYYCLVSININPHHGVINNMQLHWRAEDETIVFPNDDISNKKVTFWLENIPSDEKIKEKFASHEYIWKRPAKKESSIDKKSYRFKIREMGWFGMSFPEINIRIKTPAKLDILANFIGNTVENYNQRSESKEDFDEDDLTNLGLIHNFDYVKKKKDVYLFTFDMGTALDGVDAILQALNESDLEIELITLE